MIRPMQVLKLIWIALIFATVVWGQSNVGRITGVVKDSSGAVIPGCSVTFTNPQTGFKTVATTQETGFYVSYAICI
jgi:hypothetical protein